MASEQRCSSEMWMCAFIAQEERARDIHYLHPAPSNIDLNSSEEDFQ